MLVTPFLLLHFSRHIFHIWKEEHLISIQVFLIWVLLITRWSENSRWKFLLGHFLPKFPLSSPNMVVFLNLYFFSSQLGCFEKMMEKFSFSMLFCTCFRHYFVRITAISCFLLNLEGKKYPVVNGKSWFFIYWKATQWIQFLKNTSNSSALVLQINKTIQNQIIQQKNQRGSKYVEIKGNFQYSDTRGNRQIWKSPKFCMKTEHQSQKA